MFEEYASTIPLPESDDSRGEKQLVLSKDLVAK